MTDVIHAFKIGLLLLLFSLRSLAGAGITVYGSFHEQNKKFPWSSCTVSGGELGLTVTDALRK